MRKIIRWAAIAVATISAPVMLYGLLAAADSRFELALLDREHGCYLDVIGIYCKGFPGARIVTDALNFLYLLLLAIPTLLFVGLLSVLMTGTFPTLDTDAATMSFIAAAITWLIAFVAAAFSIASWLIRKLRQPEAGD